MKKNYDLFVIIFWIIVVFYQDPGGFIFANNENRVDDTLSVMHTFGSIAFMYIIFIFRYNNKNLMLIEDKFLQFYGIIIFIWSVYYFLWFYGLNNPASSSLLKLITRNNRMVGQILLVFPLVYFSSINLKSFVKILSWSTLIIMIMFLISVFLNLDLVKLDIGSRGMDSGLNRYFMFGYGLMYFLVPLALSYLLMKFKNERIILFSAFFVVVFFFLSILRREIIGIAEHLIILALLVNYIYKRKVLSFVWRFINVRSVAFVVITIITISIVFPKVIENIYFVAEQTYIRTVLGEGSVESTDDERVSFTAMRDMLSIIDKNMILGIGYKGTSLFEVCDYIFLSAFGLYGIVGLVIFLPFYIITFTIIVLFVKLIRENLTLIKQNESTFIYPIIVGLAASAEYIRNIIEYPNWFWPIAFCMYSPKYYIYFGLLVGSYYQLKKNIHFYQIKQFQE